MSKAAAFISPPTRRPIEQRNCPIHYVSPDGTPDETAYPINYRELYNLKGRLLTLIDATYADPEQRKAQKNMVWQTLRDWMEDIIDAADGGPVDAKAKQHEAGA